MAVKTTEQEVYLVSSFDAGFLAKSNIDAVNVFEPAIQKNSKQFKWK